MSAARTLKQLSALRVAYGVTALFAPQLMEKGAATKLDPEARYFNALFGGRDFTVVLAVLTALRAGREREAVIINASCEVTDLVALIQEVRRRGGFDTSTTIGAAFSLVGQIGAIRAARAL